MFRKMRRFKQEITRDECEAVLCRGKRGVLSVIGDDGYPYGIPVNFFYDTSDKKLYIHSAKTGHKIDAIKNNDKACFTVWCDDRLDDDGWSMHVTSVIIFGHTTLVTDADKTIDAVRKLGLKYYPSDDEFERDIKKNGDRVQIIAVIPEHISGKRVHEK